MDENAVFFFTYMSFKEALFSISSMRLHAVAHVDNIYGST